MADRCNYTSEIDMDGRMLGGEHLGSPIMLDSPLCPKVAAPPRYVIRIPSINPESDKSQNF